MANTISILTAEKVSQNRLHNRVIKDITNTINLSTKIKGYEIRSLQKTIRSLNQSTQQKLTEKKQVMYAHIYLHTDFHTHTHSYPHLRHEPHINNTPHDDS